MTDTSGANLEGDMPGVGTAPPTTGIARSPLQLPSPLQGLAKFFQGSQGPQAKPKPPFPPKPPALTEQQAHQRPEHVGRPASLAPVPAAISTPTGGFTPYIKTADKRDPSQWGNAVQFPRLPATFEVAPMLHQIGQYFAQAGGDVGQAGADLGTHSAAYWDGFMKAQDWKMRMALDGMKLHAAQLDEALTNRQTDYRDTIAEYRNAGGPDKLIGGVDMYHALWQDAIKDNDTKAVQMFEAGEPLEHIINYMHDADKTQRDLQAARQKAGDQEIDDGLFGLKPGVGADDPWSPYKRPVDKPSDPAAPQPEDKTGELDPQVPEELKREGLQVAKGIEPGKWLTKQEQRVAARYGLDLNAALDKIATDASNGVIKPEDVMPAVRRLNPSVASELQDFLDYRKGLGGASGQGQGGKEQDWYNRMGTLATAARPPKDGLGGWSSQNFQLIKDFRDTNGQVAKQLGRVGPTLGAAEQIQKDLAEIQRNHPELGPQDLMLEGLRGSTDPWFTQLRVDWLTYNQDVNALTTPGGSVTETTLTEDQIPWYGSVSAYRAALRGHIGVANERVDEYQHQWNSLGSPDPMPFLRPGDKDRIERLGAMDVVTGATPGPMGAGGKRLPDPQGRDLAPAALFGLGDGYLRYTGKNPYNHYDIKNNWVRTDDRPPAE